MVCKSVIKIKDHAKNFPNTPRIDGTSICATLAERSKVNLDLWNLLIVIVSLG